MDFIVKITPDVAMREIIQAVVEGSFSGTLVDRHRISGEDGECIVLVLEKYFMRNSSRASLTVTIDNLSGKTRVHAVGSGGGQGAIFGFDWGAGGSLEKTVENSLRSYVV